MKINSLSLKNNNSLVDVLKGALNALIISLISILVFAFIIKLTSISDALIKPINQIIKIISILFGCFLGLKKSYEKNILKGIFIGVVYTILAFVLFSSLNGKFDFSFSILLDLVFGGAIGLISAIIRNVFKKR